jgi:hypothetical protein
MGIRERCENRGPSIAVGMPFRRPPSHEEIRRPGKTESEDVAEIVAGIGNQRHRMCDEAEHQLHGDEAHVQDHAGREREVHRMVVWVFRFGWH